MQYADFAIYAIAYAVVCSHITGIPITASVQRALLAPEILNESFLKCRYFTALCCDVAHMLSVLFMLTVNCWTSIIPGTVLDAARISVLVRRCLSGVIQTLLLSS